ncbi:hypothetical protein [Flavobacterium hungaricum]|uniref:SMI1/KNR4 family protein n=1 Tax=Flavobacterium hungaricum TaxID=2082725 RepID=A0ABR9TGW5_9FLAO|nr:hypothetical protein [Flavobacterium hungaricum]MBE8724603.1 hypothetical protein [Flavobacterium hungaricum]
MEKEKNIFEKIKFNGVEFIVISRENAHEIIGDLSDFENEKIYDVFEDTWRFPDDEDNALFLLAENDVEMDVFEMDYATEERPDIFILGFIFKGNLTVKKCISSFDTDNSPALIVLGKTTAPNIILFGNLHYLGNGLECETIIGEYNHGELIVKGETTTKLIYSDDMRMRFENFTSVQSIVNLNRPDVSICSRLSDGEGSIVILENYFPSTHKLSDIAADSYVEYSDSYDQETFTADYYEKVFKQGLSLIDENKAERYLYQNFRQKFLNMITELSNKDYAASDGSLYYEDDYAKYSFVHFVYEDKNYTQISTTILNGFNIRMRAFLCVDTNEIALLLEYLYDDESTKCQWMDNEDALGIEYFAVKNAVFEAFEILNDEKSFEETDDEEDYDEEEEDEEDELTLEDLELQFDNRTLPDDLVKLFEFEKEFGAETFSECFRLYIMDKTGIKTWSEEEEFYTSFIEFATANGSGSSYAYWLTDTDLNNCPIVVFGDEGGIHVVAANTRDFIQLLSYDTEISVDHENAYFYKDEDYYEESENKEAYADWIKNTYGFEALENDEEADRILNTAKEKYKKKLNAFLEKFDIETFD